MATDRQLERIIYHLAFMVDEEWPRSPGKACHVWGRASEEEAAQIDAVVDQLQDWRDA